MYDLFILFKCKSYEKRTMGVWDWDCHAFQEVNQVAAWRPNHMRRIKDGGTFSIISPFGGKTGFMNRRKRIKNLP